MPDANEQEPDDASWGDEDESLNDDEATADDYESLDPSIKNALDREFKRREEALAEAIANGDTNNGVYKGLQKVMSRKDREIAEYRAALEMSIARVDGFGDQMAGVSEGVQWLTDTTLSALDDDTRNEAVGNLHERRAAFLEGRLNREQQRQAYINTQPQQPANDDFSAELERRMAKFVDGRKKAAERAGVDPNDPSLDYGHPTESIADRLEKFETSLQKVQDSGRVSAVRRTGAIAPTRQTGGGAPRASDGMSSLERGAAARIAAIRKGLYDKK